MSFEDDDHRDWVRAWASVSHRRLPGPLKIDVPGREEMIDVTITGVPAQHKHKLSFESDICPVCGEMTAEGNRLPGSLYPKLSNGVSYGMGVWVHMPCFEKCPIIDDPAPIPW